MELLQIGVIVDFFSLDGTAKIISTSTNQNIRYKTGNKLFLCSPDLKSRKEVIIEKGRTSSKNDFIKLNCFNTPDQVQEYKGWILCVEKNYHDLKEGYYFYSDLEGCTIINQEYTVLGSVIKVEEFPAQLTLRCRTQNNIEFFVPYIKSFITKVDIENKKIFINQIEGML